MYYILGLDAEQGTYHLVGKKEGYDYYHDVEQALDNLSPKKIEPYSEFSIINHVETRTPVLKPVINVEWHNTSHYDLNDEYYYNQL